MLPTNLKSNDYIESVAKLADMKVGSLYRSRHFSMPESILNLYNSTIYPYIEYYCNIWFVAFMYLEILDKNPRENLQCYQS